ncbi:MAG: DNA translocase FtsK [Erysipelotrichaceae bacterium]|nr:DNA translocase FtsK [Erysipelotrichaceae bacterium]
MAKKKKRKIEKEAEIKNSYTIEILGVLLIFVIVIGIWEKGAIGEIISKFAKYLAGSWSVVFLVLLSFIGLYMIVHRHKPKLMGMRIFGLYIALLGALMFAHSKMVIVNAESMSETIKETINTFIQSMDNNAMIPGGGIIGAFLASICVKLVAVEGTYVIASLLIVYGFIKVSGHSVIDVFRVLINKIRKSKKVREKDQAEIEAADNEYENDNKVIVSSVDEIIDTKPKTKEKEVIEPVHEEDLSDIEISGAGYMFPPISLLKKPQNKNSHENQAAVKENVGILEQVFADFGVEGKVVAINIGPAVTQYEMEIKAGTKVSKILSLNREVALALGARDVRIQAPIPGKKTVGVELPNKVTSIVTVREILEAVPKSKDDSKLLAVLGRDILGNPIYFEINKTPHLLVAGTTGSGKSICINSIIISLIMRTRPEEVKLVLVDPKKVELSVYNGEPHLLVPVVTEPRKANIALKKIIVEMERRYDLFSDNGVKNIAGYNTLVEKKNETLLEEQKLRKLPYIVVIIDELSDLMLVAAKEVEDSITRITQMARAAGIHLIVATQRPSTDVITGLIKANIPSRISFAVSNSIDSRTILDMVGAEKLLGKGDMLFLPLGENTPLRVQGTYISEDEISNVVNYTIAQQKAHYDNTLLMDDEEMNATSMVDSKDATEEPLYNEIVEFVVTQGKASASLLQRRFRLGYNRAARAIDLLEERGIVGPSNGSKPREVLVKIEPKNNDEDE